jgi:hypothetical protein
MFDFLDWTKRTYQRNLKSLFPDDLANLCNSIAQVANTELRSEAAIVNFYPMATNMGGHLDDAEHTMEKPIISISIGCSAIFLIGGRNRSTKPTPILVRSGDAVIMSGESRYSYHGIPLILPMDFEPLHDCAEDSDKEKEASTSCAPSETKRQQTLENVTGLLLFANNRRDTGKSGDAETGVERAAKGENYGGEMEDKVKDNEEEDHILRYLCQARININARQVRVGDGGEDDLWIEKAGTGASYGR